MRWPGRNKKAKKYQFIELIPGRLRVGVAEDKWFTIRGDYTTLGIVTEGMRALGQKDLIFSLQPGEGEGVKLVQEVLSLINEIYEQVCIGNIVDVGGMTTVGGIAGGFFGPDGYQGFIYANPTPYSEMDYLAAVPLKQDELDVAGTYGQTRVLAKLGQRQMFYPFPPFGERRRAAIFTLGDMENSFLGKSPAMSCYDSCVWVSDPGFDRENKKASILATSVNWKKSPLTLMMGGTSASELAGNIAQLTTHDAMSLTLLTSVFPEIDNCLVYMPSSIPSMIRTTDSNDARCAGNFIAAGEGSRDDVLAIEDGFGLVLTRTRWVELLGSLESRRPLQFPPEGEFPGFELVWKNPA